MPEACFQQLEDQGNKRARKVRKRAEAAWDSDNLAKMTKRWNKMRLKQRTVLMRKVRLEYAKGLLMDQVDAENRQFPMIALDDTSMTDGLEMLVRQTADIPEADSVEECNMPAEITMPDQDDVIKGVMEMLVRKTEEKAEAEAVEAYNTPHTITMAELNEIKCVLDMLVGKNEEIFQNEEDVKMCFDMMLHEIVVDLVLNEIINVQEESWKTVPKSLGWKDKAQKERTGLHTKKSSKIYDTGTEIVEFVEEKKQVQIEIEEGLYAQPSYAKHGRDAMGRFVIEDRIV